MTEFDLACLSATGAVFDRLLALHPAQVVVDLSGCRHIDAAAIGLLLDVHRRLTRADAVLTVRDPNPRIWRILQSARLDQVLPIVAGRTPDADRPDRPDRSDRSLPSGSHRTAPTPAGRAAVPVRGLPDGTPAGGPR